MVKFGPLRIGQTVKKIVPIVNNSAAPITFRVTMHPVSPGLQESGVVRLLPTDPVTLQQKGGMAKVEVILSPKSRIAQFSEEVRFYRRLSAHAIFRFSVGPRIFSETSEIDFFGNYFWSCNPTGHISCSGGLQLKNSGLDMFC